MLNPERQNRPAKRLYGCDPQHRKTNHILNGFKMKITIYGKVTVLSVNALQSFLSNLKPKGSYDYEYIDIVANGIDAVALGELTGKPVRTVPQILVDGRSIGSYNELATLATTL